MDKPRSDSLAARMLAYFQANPDEELLRQDVAEKFGAKMKSVDFAIGRLRDQGYLESVHVVRLRERGIAK